MESEKVKEIKVKEALEILCYKYKDVGSWEITKPQLMDILTLINDLESENERLKKENAKLDSELDKRDCIDYPCRLIEKDQLKQFAEKLKIECVNKIHETLKEFIGSENS